MVTAAQIDAAIVARLDELARIDDAAELLGVTLPTEDEDDE